jgi:ABC-type transport system substrate-binding protein
MWCLRFERFMTNAPGSALADSMTANGRRIAVRAVDSHTVELIFAEPFAAGVRLLDNLPILPQHVLGPALDSGTLASAWGLSMPPSSVVGLGPFVLAAYEPGQRSCSTGTRSTSARRRTARRCRISIG